MIWSGAGQPLPRITVVVLDAAASDRGYGDGVEIVGRTPVPAEATRQAVARRPQLLIVDLDGVPAAVTAIDALASAVPQIPVLALAAAPDHATVLAAVRAGATSVVRSAPGEPAAAAALADAVTRTARGEAVFSPGLADVVLSEFGRPTDPQLVGRTLTQREVDVLRLVVEGLTARQVGTRLGLSPRTVENHVQNMLRKLRLRTRAALVRYAIENGLA